MSVTDEPAGGTPEGPAEQGWRRDGQGRWSVPAQGRRGNVYRRENETPQEAQDRDARERAKDKPPKPKKTPPKAIKSPAPTQVDLKELEFLLAEGFKAPSMIPAMLGDEWPAEHIVSQAPILARNLVKAAQYNPWLRAKLEAAVTGEDLMVKLITASALAGSTFMYLVPVIAYYTGLGGAQAREMFEIPDRAEVKRQESDAQAAPSPAAAEAARAPAPVAAAA